MQAKILFSVKIPFRYYFSPYFIMFSPVSTDFDGSLMTECAYMVDVSYYHAFNVYIWY